VPIYDYTCGACGRVTEVIHGINDQGPKFCPNCGAEGRMRKALTAPAIVFKGSGWAKVDRRSTSGSSSSSSAGRSAKSSSKASDGASTATSGGDTSSPTSSGRPAGASGGGAGGSGDGGSH